MSILAAAIFLKMCTLQATKVRLYNFCAKIANIYKEPLPTQIVADPTGAGSNEAKKFIGPWNPEKSRL
jgi:hypothetical protein